MQSHPFTSAVLSYLDQGRAGLVALHSMDPASAPEAVVSASAQLLSSAAETLLIFGETSSKDEPRHAERPSENGILQHG